MLKIQLLGLLAWTGMTQVACVEQQLHVFCELETNL
jgi:hypothetical protein